jgi:type IV fimbrial biogenesis protein FimT
MNGFTIVEALTLLGCIALLTTLVIGSNRSWFIQQNSNSTIDQLVRDLHFARQQAIIRKTIITLCPTFNGESCIATPDWSSGYLIFVDPQGKRQYDNPSALLVNRTISRGILTNSRDHIQFAATGFTRSHNSTFLYLLENVERRVIISLQGRIRIE